MKRRFVASILALSAALLGPACGRLQTDTAANRPERADRQDTDVTLRMALAASMETAQPPAFVTRDQEGARLWHETRAFYRARDFGPAWIVKDAARRRIDALIGAVRAARDEGIDPELYGLTLIEQSRQQAASDLQSRRPFEPRSAAVMDAWLTYLYLQYASDLANGISDLAHADAEWQIDTEPFDARGLLERALRDDRIAQSLAELLPGDTEYRALRKALAAYRALAAQGGWPAVPAALTLKPGQASPDLATLALRLQTSGELAPGDRVSDTEYGTALQAAVKRFQLTHGLADDGVVGPAVVAAMNVPVEDRIRQIELNMERWRWLPRDLGSPHILVNLPEMRLDVREDGRTPLTMRVVVGKQDTPTPIFNHRMTYLVFAPYWNVPDDIARKETLPAALKDAGFLDRTNMEVVDKSGRAVDPATVDLNDPGRYRFRQRPGTSNSLGLVKFMFPNSFNVYLHDTPAESLFARASRSFSHGCVRLEAPEKLASFVLRDQPEWTPERIEAAMHAGEEKAVKLKAPVPVYLGYWTARVANDGRVQFWKDVYGIDGRQRASLTAHRDHQRHTIVAAASTLAPPAATMASR